MFVKQIMKKNIDINMFVICMYFGFDFICSLATAFEAFVSVLSRRRRDCLVAVRYTIWM